jgi:hypothetical protein
MWIEPRANRLFNPLLPDFRHVRSHNVENFSTWHPEDVHRLVGATPGARRAAARAADASRREPR